MTSRNNSKFCAAITICTLLLPLHGGLAQAAPSSFELELKDLETTKPSPKPRHRQTRQPRKAIDSDHASAATAGFTRYTVKPGDFLFKILIRNFGLSNAQAEALIPEIQRLNKLPSATRLEVGQTILIPRTRRTPAAEIADKPAPVPQEEEHHPLVIPPVSSSAIVPQPAAPVVPEPPAPHRIEPPEQIAPAPQQPQTQEPAKAPEPAPPAPDQTPHSFAASLIRLWEEIVPGQEMIEPLTVDGKVLNPDDYPLLLSADGGRILVDVRNTLPAGLRSQIVRKYPDIRIVTRGKDSLRLFFSTLMKAAEFARIEENVTVNLGADPLLSVRADFRIVRLPSGRGGPETVLVFLEENGPCLPASLTGYLERKGYQVAQLSNRSDDAIADPGYDLRSIPPSSPCDMAMSLLEALSIKLDRNKIVSGTMGENADNRFSIRVESYFEASGKRFVLDCTGNDPYNYTLFRLLKVQGYGVIQPQGNDDFNAVAEHLLTELNYPHAFGRYELDYGRYKITITGFKITRRDNSTGRLILSSRPADPVFADLMRWEPGGKR